jgi:hypothetical protein
MDWIGSDQGRERNQVKSKMDQPEGIDFMIEAFSTAC